MNQKQKTKLLTEQEALESRKWYLFDATGKTLGRFAAEVAKILRGKHRPDYTPHVDCGDGVVIVNAEKVVVTGMKRARKIYRKYTGFIGGMREIPYSTMIARNPEMVLERAIKGMMPKTRLGGQQVRKLRIFKGANHDLKAQQPIPVNL
ncbi:MAG: 50S ribosomal protein L13 [Verrucomicrobia bacterium]|nr:50S ribosomal protein L13 [Verrucomicrobiota bacterium]MBU6446449.1 50S ribosomal protein L13 [Verrucomicrobiota bacterium]MDE3047940.1 50S ribosomal protein L13 [Verrucomicrobiota bacterium]